MRACAWAIAVVLAFAAPSAAQRTSVSRDFPIYDNGGLPDLTIDPQRFTAQMDIVDRLFDPLADECAPEEGVIGGAGYRLCAWRLSPKRIRTRRGSERSESTSRDGFPPRGVGRGRPVPTRRVGGGGESGDRQPQPSG